MHGLATTVCLTSLAVLCVGALPLVSNPLPPSYEASLTRLEKSLAEIDVLGHRDNDFGQLMLESGEESDLLSRLLLNRQAEKLGLRQGRLRERRGKKSKEKRHRYSKEKRRKSQEKKHRKSKEKKHRKSREKCGGGRGKSKERYPCTTSVTTTDTMTASTGSTTTLTVPTTALTTPATTTTTDTVTFTEPFENSEEVETLIPFFPEGVDDGLFPDTLFDDSEPFV